MGADDILGRGARPSLLHQSDDRASESAARHARAEHVFFGLRERNEPIHSGYGHLEVVT